MSLSVRLSLSRCHLIRISGESDARILVAYIHTHTHAQPSASLVAKSEFAWNYFLFIFIFSVSRFFQWFVPAFCGTRYLWFLSNIHDPLYWWFGLIPLLPTPSVPCSVVPFFSEMKLGHIARIAFACFKCEVTIWRPDRFVHVRFKYIWEKDQKFKATARSLGKSKYTSSLFICIETHCMQLFCGKIWFEYPERSAHRTFIMQSYLKRKIYVRICSALTFRFNWSMPFPK